MTSESSFPHRHLLDIESLSSADILDILELAEKYVEEGKGGKRRWCRLEGKTVVNLFVEPSTRTRTSFEIAARRLGADVVNVMVEHSSMKKGETLLDTVRNINAMQVDAFVIRHRENGAPHSVIRDTQASVINAGDGSNEHPTQGLLDALTMRRRKGRLDGLNVAICGDIEHSRVARSNVRLLKKLGGKPRVIAPSVFMPKDLDKLGVPAFDNMAEGLRDADVVVMLRIQHERLADGEFAMSLKDYHQRYGLDHEKLKLAKPDVIVMHPGPINRDVEISSSLADDKQYSVILDQVGNGVAVRMACLDLLLAAGRSCACGHKAA